MASRSVQQVESTVRETLPDGTFRVKTTIRRTTPDGGTYTEEKMTMERQRGVESSSTAPTVAGARRSSRFTLSKLFQPFGGSSVSKSSQPSSVSSPDTLLPLAQYRQQLLNDHNKKRAKHGACNLTISDELNSVAQEWAEHLASMNRMQHRPVSGYGENVFSGYNSARPIPASQVTDSWYDEIRQYDYDRPSTDECGHFTQIVWKESKEVGFGRAISKNGKTYVVANYYPPGNVLGKFKENITRPSR